MKQSDPLRLTLVPPSLAAKLVAAKSLLTGPYRPPTRTCGHYTVRTWTTLKVLLEVRVAETAAWYPLKAVALQSTA